MSGTKNAPETPRQKMIGMMYLVLTAMLALNVSSEILSGFKLVDDSLHTSISSSEEQNSNLYKEFEALLTKNKEKTEKWYKIAKTVNTEADALYGSIHQFKAEILKIADKEEADTVFARNIIHREDLQAGNFFAINQGNAGKLKLKIERYRDFLMTLSGKDKSLRQSFESMFNTGDINKKTWESATFENMPVAAIITILTKYQNDVRSSESKMIQYLKEMTDETDVRVNVLDAFVLPESNYVLEGQEYKAEIILAAIDSTQRPQVFIGGRMLNGNIFRASTSRAGVFDYSGYISIPGNGNYDKIPFKASYTVGKPAAIISNDDLNILYKGFDNNISISAPGIPNDQLSISVNGGSAVPKGNGKYIIKTTASSVDISVIGKVGGRAINMGKNTYRVKQLPDPKPYAVYKDANGNTKSVFDGSVHGPTFVKGVPTVTAGYGEDALIQANFTVKSFSIKIGRRTYNSTSSKFTPDQINVVAGLPSGTMVTIQRIRAVGPDGIERNLSAVAIEIL